MHPPIEIKKELPSINTRLLLNALQYYGVKEVEGKTSEPNIEIFVRRFFSSLPEEYDTDRINWCALFINYLLNLEGLPETNSPVARSFLKIGEPTEEPLPGDLVVFWRDSPKSWKGHVSIYIRSHGGYIYCLGGNQSNAVRVSRYPKQRLLGYRRITDKKTV